jgi:hypothetical protein
LARRAREVGAGFEILRPDRPLQNAAVESWWTMSTNDCEDRGLKRQGKIAPCRDDFAEAAIYDAFAVRFWVRSLI